MKTQITTIPKKNNHPVTGQQVKVISSSPLSQHYDILCGMDAVFKTIVEQYGHPPVWVRKNSFETLVHIILEQQVSLASAKAALNKLKATIGTITPTKVLALTDAQLRSCYFSRQKTGYVRHLAELVISKQLNIQKLTTLSNEEVRLALKKVKGIGDWTVDVYLMMVLQRTDLFPLGDVALINSVKEVKGLARDTGKEHIAVLAENWRPYRTAASFLFWHSYLCKRNRSY